MDNDKKTAVQLIISETGTGTETGTDFGLFNFRLDLLPLILKTIKTNSDILTTTTARSPSETSADDCRFSSDDFFRLKLVDLKHR